MRGAGERAGEVTSPAPRHVSPTSGGSSLAARSWSRIFRPETGRKNRAEPRKKGSRSVPHWGKVQPPNSRHSYRNSQKSRTFANAEVSPCGSTASRIFVLRAAQSENRGNSSYPFSRQRIKITLPLENSKIPTFPRASEGGSQARTAGAGELRERRRKPRKHRTKTPRQGSKPHTRPTSEVDNVNFALRGCGGCHNPHRTPRTPRPPRLPFYRSIKSMN